jgi:signal transduction histidine kinase
MRFLPRSLFGRTLLVLAAGLLVVELASVILNLMDRGGSVYQLAAGQMAARIAQAARILNRLPAAKRRAILAELGDRQLQVALSARRLAVIPGYEEQDRYENAFAAMLHRRLGASWPVSVEITPHPPGQLPVAEEGAMTALEMWITRYFYYLRPQSFSVVVQVGLEDGSVAVFDATIPQEPLGRLKTLALRLLLIVAACFALAAVLVYMMTQSLQRLARDADTLGENPERPALPESGPSEVLPVIAAFNRMRARMHAQLRERTGMLGAISHDLKTPIMRLRLRSEMCPDGDMRSKMQGDLNEMDAMIGATLDFFRDLDPEPERRPLDVNALVESVCEDHREVGQAVAMRGAATTLYEGDVQALRRCLENLVENAIAYGGNAEIEIDDAADRLRIAVRDHGSGIPEAELERVFEPYYRLESSRNRRSGGTGLGLSIARNIARRHGGDIVLRNAPGGGGLIAALELPRRHGARGA